MQQLKKQINQLLNSSANQLGNPAEINSQELDGLRAQIQGLKSNVQFLRDNEQRMKSRLNDTLMKINDGRAGAEVEHKFREQERRIESLNQKLDRSRTLAEKLGSQLQQGFSRI